jgi:thiamine biosynthesis lipoprotein
MQVYSNAFYAMNTRLVYVLPGVENTQGDTIHAKLEQEVEDWEQVLSRFRENAELAIINRTAMHHRIGVSNRLAGVLELCDGLNRYTEGLFDPAYATVYDAIRRQEVQTKQEQAELIEACGWQQVEWHSEDKSIQFLSPHVKIDLGGIGKGVALKSVIQLLKDEGIESAFVSFGESSIACIGKHPKGDHWPVKVDESMAPFHLIDQVLSISGLQEKEGQFQAHIFNPSTNEMEEKQHLAVVKSECPIRSEALSTAAYLANQEQLNQLQQRFPQDDLHQIEKIQIN